MDALTLHRIHFAFTITYHYLFPRLTAYVRCWAVSIGI